LKFKFYLTEILTRQQDEIIIVTGKKHNYQPLKASLN